MQISIPRFIRCIFFVLFFLIAGNLKVHAGTDGLFSVTFINPGVSDQDDPTGSFWLSVSEFMEAAAGDLTIDLEVLYAERKFVRMVELAREISGRDTKPDYLILVNEKLIAPQLLDIVKDTGCKVLLILNDLTPEQKKSAGGPREKYPNWIGTIIPNNVDAGYQIAKQIINAGLRHDFNILEMIAISGNRVTPASVYREMGLKNAIAEHKDAIVFKQLTYGEWRKDLGYIKSKVLMQRYPNTRLVWAANDPMALGAVKAAEETGKVPGKTIFVGGLNWSREALEAIRQGRLVTTVGGHFMIGGWSLVVLYDYHNQIDFPVNQYELKLNIFRSINADNLAEYEVLLEDGRWNRIDFTKFSKKINPEVQRYDFFLGPK